MSSYELLVPHNDDELLFLWPWIEGASRVGFVTDCGWTRTVETAELWTRAGFVASVWRGLVQMGYGQVVGFDGSEPMPLEIKALWPRLAGFLAGVPEGRRVGIPWLDDYAHVHHVQLREFFDASCLVAFEEEEVECLRRREKFYRDCILHWSYRSVVPEAIEDVVGLARCGVRWYRKIL